MLKFKGRPWALKCFFEYLKEEYGATATIKEILEKGKVK